MVRTTLGGAVTIQGPGRVRMASIRLPQGGDVWRMDDGEAPVQLEIVPLWGEAAVRHCSRWPMPHSP